jgi:alkanesulfonate monooxygenase SsuD/methylene tetrahydromethanopterin reductase-like flavin-dependent oxidoreductase (luciferase family)
LTADEFADLNARLEGLLREVGRPPEAVRRTLMTRGIFGRTQAEVDRKLDGVAREDLNDAVIVGSTDEFVDRLGRLSDVGVRRVMLQWLETDDLDGLEAMAGSVLPQL